MLSRELMATALLGLSWLTALMVALDALIDARAMRQRLAKWKHSLVRVEVKADELASHEVEQRIKQLDGDGPGLVFFDRKHVSLVKGGAVVLDGATVEVVGAPGAEVWIDAATRAQAAACHGTAQFDAMLTAAQGAGGGLRAVRSFVRAGQPAWLEGRREGERFVATLVANFDPQTFARSRIAATFGLVLVNFAWVALGTVIALWPPAFGWVSVGGAVVLIGHFLGMTPLAIVTREKSRAPSVAFIRGAWHRDAVKHEVGSASSAVVDG